MYAEWLHVWYGNIAHVLFSFQTQLHKLFKDHLDVSILMTWSTISCCFYAPVARVVATVIQLF